MSAATPTATRPPRAYILLLNWNQWRDTLRCLESVLRLSGPRFTVLVCDNDSSDGSVERIAVWAEGRLEAPDDGMAPLRHLHRPPAPKPVPYRVLDRAAAEAGAPDMADEPPLLLIRTGGNRGFAAGCNVGLRYALARADWDYVWLLNTDTLAAPDALAALVAEAARDPGLGLIGSTVRDYERPEIVQALGGCSFAPLLVRPRHLGAGRPASAPVDAAAVRRRLDYVLGASMLATRPFLETVGPMDERFFLYFEEIDWAMRARGRFRLGFAPDSVVWHRMGGASGHAGARAYGNATERLMFRNRLAFARKHVPWALPTVYLGLMLAFAKAAAQGRWGRVRMFCRPSFWVVPRPGDPQR